MRYISSFRWLLLWIALPLAATLIVAGTALVPVWSPILVALPAGVVGIPAVARLVGEDEWPTAPRAWQGMVRGFLAAYFTAYVGFVAGAPFAALVAYALNPSLGAAGYAIVPLLAFAAMIFYGLLWALAGGVGGLAGGLAERVVPRGPRDVA